VCLRHGITWLALFGSVATGEATPASDADVLVEFEPGRRVTYLDLERIAVELSPLFGHRPIDLAKPKQLHWAIRDRVLSEAIVLYGRR
jgi:predicted nucleotidyltransferase